MHEVIREPIGSVNHEDRQNDGDNDQPVMDLAKGYALFQFIHFASPIFGKRWRSGRLHRVPDLYAYSSTA
jgi:hypothetical protein